MSEHHLGATVHVGDASDAQGAAQISSKSLCTSCCEHRLAAAANPRLMRSHFRCIVSVLAPAMLDPSNDKPGYLEAWFQL